LIAKAATRRYLESLGRPKPRRWEDWEKKFVLDHPFHSCREIAFALGRSIRSVMERRTDPDNRKRVCRYRKTRRIAGA
jgi:hypothetical protein